MGRGREGELKSWGEGEEKRREGGGRKIELKHMAWRDHTLKGLSSLGTRIV